MTLKTLTICTLSLATIITLSACSNIVEKPLNIKKAQYWQRTTVSETTYMRGPKAQQTLNKHIASCVAELRELERLGQIKGAIPLDGTGGFINPAVMDARNWDLPERDRALFIEHSDYQDFYGCMLAKGWERTQYVPYKTTLDAEDAYTQNHIKTRDQNAAAHAQRVSSQQNAYAHKSNRINADGLDQSGFND